MLPLYPLATFLIDDSPFQVGRPLTSTLSLSSSCSCCVDVLGAEQAGAQALVHFGPACLSPPARLLPITFVLGQRSVALELCAKAFEAQNPDPTAPVVLLSEPACAHALGEKLYL